MKNGVLGFAAMLLLGVAGTAEASGNVSGRVGAGLGAYQFTATVKDTGGTTVAEFDESDSTFGVMLGGTLGVGKFYADVGMEHSAFAEGDDLDGDGEEDGTFRSDFLLSGGYFIGERWVAFLGYRRSTYGDGFFSDEGGNVQYGPFFGGGGSFRVSDRISLGASLAVNVLTLEVDGQPIDNLDLVGVSAKVQANLLETPHSVFLRIQAFNGNQEEAGIGELEYTESYVTIGYQATFDFKTW